MIEAIRERRIENCFYGARVSGGGSGGTVVVLLGQEALSELKQLANKRLLIV